MSGSVAIPAQRISPDAPLQAITRAVPVEAPIAIEYNGIGYAVMMATPTDLDDFAIGFSLSERIIGAASDVKSIEAVETDLGWLLKIDIAETCVAPMIERVRVRVSESSCGLCGLENLEQVARPLPVLDAGPAISDEAIFRAIEALRNHQPLNLATGGAHAAAFCDAEGTILYTREDVGRHCALDKLIGALARDGMTPQSGFFLLSSRCSYELVEKTVIARCPALVTISTATSLAVERARAAGLQLIALARQDSALSLTR
jgi:FdhD protein